MGSSRRRFWANVVAGVGLAALAWAIVIGAGGALDTHLFGLRVRATDPYHAGLIAVVAFAVYAWLRRSPSTAKLSGAERRTRLVRALPIAAILLVAGVARFWGIAFGLPHPNARPDEGGVGAIAGAYFYGHWNPHTFNYPPFFMLVIAGVMRFVLPVWRRLLADFKVHAWIPINSTIWRLLIARVLSAAAGVASVWVVYRIGMRLFDRRTALSAAALLALAFLHVRDSHFGVTDVAMTFMLVVAFLWVVRLSESATTRDVLVAGAAAGLATATKYNAMFVALPAAFAILTDPSGRPILVRVGRIALFAGAMVIAFLIVCPFAILDSQKFLGDVMFEARHLAEGHAKDLGPGWLYHATTTLRYGLGLPLFGAGVLGLVAMLWRSPRKGMLVALYPVCFYVLAGSGHTVFFRYMLPVVPFLCLSAGYLVSTLSGTVARSLSRERWAPAFTAAVVALVLWPSARSVLAFDRVIARTDSRVVARRWVEARFPMGTSMAQLGWDAGHPFLFDDNEVPYGDVNFVPGNLKPRLVIVHASPMTDPENLNNMDDVLKTEYQLQFEVHAASVDPANVYDRQDEFYVPYAGFRQIERPGPNVRIYVRVDRRVPDVH